MAASEGARRRGERAGRGRGVRARRDNVPSTRRPAVVGPRAEVVRRAGSDGHPVRVSRPFRVAPSRARRVRRGFPIHAYIGPNGYGKSLAMVYDTLPSLAAGRLVLSTVRLLDPATGAPHPLWIPLDDPRLLLDPDLPPCDVLMDEIAGVASAREWSSMHPAVAKRLDQLRRGDFALRWTAPAWRTADTTIRRVSQGVTISVGLAPVAVHHDDGTERLWQSRRGFLWRTYSTEGFDEWSSGKRLKLRPRCRQFFWRPGSVASSSYDTFDAVLSFGQVSEGGTCLDCGGTRSRPRCICENNTRSLLPPPRRLFPETDDTPAVLVEHPDAAPL